MLSTDKMAECFLPVNTDNVTLSPGKPAASINEKTSNDKLESVHHVPYKCNEFYTLVFLGSVKAEIEAITF
jgi:hypothetical protein